MTIAELDGRTIPHETRLPAIVNALAGLAAGDSLVLVAPHQPARLLQLLMGEFPGRFVFGPLECGPDAWRWQFTARDPEVPRTVTDYLVWDHRRMEKLLEEAQTAASSGRWEDAHLLASRYATALRRHADLEDEVLFPAYEKACGGFGDGPTAHMRDEHVQIRRGIDSLLLAVQARDAAAVGDADELLRRVAIEHHTKEEEILFPSVDEAFSRPELDALVLRLLFA